MKILHVETGRHFLGGPQQVIYLIKALREQGHDNILVCPPDSGIDRVARAAGIQIENLSCGGDFDLGFAYRAARLMGRHAADVVHCHSRRGADFLGGRAANFAGVPAVVSRRVDNTERPLLAALRYKPFRKIVAISEAVGRVLRAQEIDDDRIVVIRDAVDSNAFSTVPDRGRLEAEFGIDNGVTAIAAAGQLIRRKGHRYLLDAAAQLKINRASFRLVIFGAGYLDTELRVQAASLGLGDVVQFAGFRDDLDELIACFDMLAHPALAEGLGVVALKAAAAGMPVVGFSAGGMTEAVENGVTGLLVPPGDTTSLQDAIAQLIKDPDRRRRFGLAGQKRMQTEFSIDTMAARHAALYETVVNGRPHIAAGTRASAG